MQQAIAGVRQENPDFKTSEIAVIPHGGDTKLFHSYSKKLGTDGIKRGRLRAKKILLPNTIDFLDFFIVLNANRNQPRKRIEITMQGFALFAENKPDNVKLYLHMGVEDIGWNLMSLAKRYDIEGRLIISNTSKETPPIRLSD